MPFTKSLVLLVRDLELPHVSQRGVGVVLPRDHEHLEALPAKRLQLRNPAVHVLLVVELADHGVQLEFDAVLEAPFRDFGQLSHVVAIAAADGDIGGFVEGVAGHGEDVDVLPVFLEEGLVDQAAVRDD